MLDLGDRRFGSVICFPFLTQVAGVPTALVSGTVSVYKNDDWVQSTAGIRLQATFDSPTVTGLNFVRIDMSQAPAFYSTQNDYSVILTAGTVGGLTVAGYPLATFSVENRAALTKVTLVDGIELDDLLTIILATLSGKAVRPGSGSLVQYLKVDGLTTSNDVTVGSEQGVRTARNLYT